MIQRIQTLYLLAVLLLQALALNFSFLNFEKDGINYLLNSKGVFPESKIIFLGDYGILLLGILGILMALGTVFLFKNRRLQIKLSNVYLFIAVAQIALVFFYIYQLIKTDYIKMLPGTSFYLIFVSMIFAFLAIRAINKDENLIKSVDRIR